MYVLGVEAASLAAQDEASKTATMLSLACRSNYVNADSMKGIPDPGAVAVAEAFKIAAGYLSSAK
jgi:triose/dihydroxyacetone kinase / FAD-AMP lyase (cyclizing)